jgi:uncharacterized protein YhaN
MKSGREKGGKCKIKRNKGEKNGKGKIKRKGEVKGENKCKTG